MTWNTLLAGGPEPVPDVPVGETKTPGTETHDADGQETPSEPTPEEKGAEEAARRLETPFWQPKYRPYRRAH